MEDICYKNFVPGEVTGFIEANTGKSIGMKFNLTYSCLSKVPISIIAQNENSGECFPKLEYHIISQTKQCTEYDYNFSIGRCKDSKRNISFYKANPCVDGYNLPSSEMYSCVECKYNIKSR